MQKINKYKNSLTNRSNGAAYYKPNERLTPEYSPVWYVNADDAGLQQLSILVSAGGQEPPLVMGQAVGHKKHVVFLSSLSKSLTQLCLLVLHWCQHEWWCVEM